MNYPLCGEQDKIAFVNNRDKNTEIYVMGGDGSGQVRLTNNSVDDYIDSIYSWK